MPSNSETVCQTATDGLQAILCDPERCKQIFEKPISELSEVKRAIKDKKGMESFHKKHIMSDTVFDLGINLIKECVIKAVAHEKEANFSVTDLIIKTLRSNLMEFPEDLMRAIINRVLDKASGTRIPKTAENLANIAAHAAWNYLYPDTPFSAEQSIKVEKFSPIMPKNLAVANRLANEGKSAKLIGWRIALAEFLKGFLTPGRFINAHPAQEGAKAVVEAGVQAATIMLCITGLIMIGTAMFMGPALTFSILLGEGIPGLLSILLGAAGAHLRKQAQLDWHFIKESGLTEAVKKFGAATVDSNGKVHTNIYFMNRLPEHPEEYDLKTTGMVINGKQVWASTGKGALVMFAEAESGEFAQMADGKLVKKEDTNIEPSKKAVNRIKGLLKKANVDTLFSGFERGIIVDYSVEGKTISYNEWGTTVVSADYFSDIDSKDKEGIAARLSDVMAIRNGEKNALAQNIYFELEKGTKIEGLERSLKAFTAAGNGQMIVYPEVFSGLRKEQVKGIAKLARKCGVQIFIGLPGDATQGTKASYREMGFAGYSAVRDGETVIYDYSVSESEGEKAEIITGYQTPEDLKDKLNKSKNACKILYISEITALLTGKDESILDKVALTELFKMTILSLYNSNVLTEEFVSKVGYGWEMEKLPVYSAAGGVTDKLVEALKKDDIKGLVEMIGANSIKMYMSKIERETVREGSEKTDALKSAFMRAIVEKILAKQKLEEVAGRSEERAGLKNGLADSRLEVILGQALLKQKEKKWEARELSAGELKGYVSGDDINTAEYYIKLFSKVTELNGAGEDPQALNAEIELIAQLGEAKQTIHTEDEHMLFNAQAMERVLEAA